MTTAAVETRRLYMFENLTGAISEYANKERSLSFLQAIANVVWVRHGRKGCAPPVVRFGPGVAHGKVQASYTEGRGLIELIENQRNVGVLLHELTHCMGFGMPHGRAFVRKYLDLLVEYGRCERTPLVLDASMFGLKP